MMLDGQSLHGLTRSTVSGMVRAVRDGLSVMRMPDGSLVVSDDPLTTLRTLKRVGDDSTIRSIITDACQKGEAIGMGSSKYLIRTLASVQRHRDAGVCMDEIESWSRMIIDGLPGVSMPSTETTLLTCLTSLVPDVAPLITEATRLAGSECKIFVEPSTNGQTTVERIDGHTFKVTPDPMILRAGKWASQSVKCLVVDGIIDKISEIDSLLARCNREQRSMAVFARGFSDEVIATLRVNHARKTLNVMPVNVDFDLETVNVLLDIAMVLGCDVVSSLKGELISTVKFDQLPEAASISCIGSSLTIVTSRSTSCDVHLRNLIQKRNAETLPLVKLILDKRIRSLSSSSVLIKIPDAGSRGSKLLHDIDAGLKVVRNVLQFGAISADSIKRLDPNGLLKDVLDNNIVPVLSLGTGIFYAVSTAKSLETAATIISCISP